MTPGILAALAALSSLCAVTVCALAIRHRRACDRERDFALTQAERAISDAQHLERDRGRLEARIEHLQDHADDLDRHLDGYRGSPLEGRTVVVNTPKPDDQAFRGVVLRDLKDDGVVLAAAVYLERESSREGETVREVPAGEVHVRRVAWTQLLNPTQEG